LSISYPQPILLNVGGHDTYALPVDPFSAEAGHDNLLASVGSTVAPKRVLDASVSSDECRKLKRKPLPSLSLRRKSLSLSQNLLK
jgi:hypothetical protein